MLFSWIQNIREDPLNGIALMLIQVLSLLGALILHEISHGYVALWCGDPTAKMMGRLSLRPSHHLDPIGTTMLLLFGFGYARPVPVNPNNFRRFRRDDFLVSIAGITMNFLLFLISGFLMVLTTRSPAFSEKGFIHYLFTFFNHFSSLNLSLALFNLLPIPPLDGFHLLNDTLLKGKLRLTPDLFRMFQIGLMVLLLGTSLVDNLLYRAMNAIWSPVITFFYRLVWR